MTSQEALAPPEYLQLWMTLARRSWDSVVLIPADPDGSTADVARSLADVGQRLSFAPLTAITMSALEYGSALALADLQQHMERGRQQPPAREPLVEVAGRVVTPSEEEPGPFPQARDGKALAFAPPARLVISVPSVIAEPLGLAVAHHADLILVSVHMGRSRLANVRRTVELVGRDRIAGCFLVR
jgi:hypothetical protein